MPSSRRFKIVTLAVFIAAIAVGLVVAAVSVWAWTTEEDVHPFFAWLFPALTIWLAVALIRLVVHLRRDRHRDDDWCDPLKALYAAPRRMPDEAMRRSWPGAEFYQSILLPPDPETPWWQGRWRRRSALHIRLPHGHRLIVARTSVIARQMVGGRS
ncbi:hypothetical protein BH11PSE3_BH11PSE3_22150 [soil metagenome]